jgi:hypothetical protein
MWWTGKAASGSASIDLAPGICTISAEFAKKAFPLLAYLQHGDAEATAVATAFAFASAKCKVRHNLFM